MGQAGAAPLGIGAVDGNAQGPPLTNNDDLLLAASDGGVEQRPGEHDIVRILQVEDHGAVLRPLGFVDGGGVTQIQLIQH